MFSRVLITALLALPAFVFAAPSNAPSGDCNTKDVHCCESVQAAPGNGATNGGLGVLPIGVVPLLGIQCTPIAVLGLAGTTCGTQTVCCKGNNFNGLVNALNCFNLNLAL